jgi:hypothetical protein
MKHTRALLATFLVLLTLFAVGCGGNTNTKNTNPTTAQGLIDPSGNWGMTFTDSNGNFFILSALYFQTGAVVTGINFSEVGNVAPGLGHSPVPEGSCQYGPADLREKSR